MTYSGFPLTGVLPGITGVLNAPSGKELRTSLLITTKVSIC